MTLKRLITLATAALALGLCGGCGYAFRAEDTFRVDADAAGIRTVCVETRNGGIELRGDATGGKVNVQGEKHARGVSHEDAEAACDQIEIHAQRDPSRPDRLHIYVDVPPELRDRSPGARMVVSAPRDAAFELNTTNGGIRAEDVAGPLHADTSNGSIRVARIRDAAEVRTTNGGITATQLDGDLTARTSNGNIRLDSVGRGRVNVRTTNGAVTGENLRGEVIVESSNGSIGLRIAQTTPAPEIRAMTSNGSVRVELPADVNARLSMRTSNGGVYSDLGATRVSDFRTSRNRLDATLNAGGGSIELVSSNGSVTIEARAVSTPSNVPSVSPTVAPVQSR